MYPHIKAQWAAALLGGKFCQVRGRLGDLTGHDPLGVLAELACAEGAAFRRLVDGGVYEYQSMPCAWWQNLDPYPDASTVVLPRSAAEWAGIGVQNPVVQWRDYEDYLTALADQGLDDQGRPLDFQALWLIIDSQVSGPLAPCAISPRQGQLSGHNGHSLYVPAHTGSVTAKTVLPLEDHGGV